MKKLMIASIVALTAGTASAQDVYIKAPIVDVQPNGRVVYENVPQQSCKTVEVPIYGQRQGGASAGDVLGGMIIGGLIGKGATGKDNGAAAGAVIGGMIAADKKQGDRPIVGYKQQQQCTTDYVRQERYVNDGYTVVYELNGRTYNIQTNQRMNVGDYVRLRMKVVGTQFFRG